MIRSAIVALVLAACGGLKTPLGAPSVSPAVPASSGVPKGWVPIVLADEQQECAKRSNDDWRIAIERGEVTITKLAPGERDSDSGPAVSFDSPKRHPRHGPGTGRRRHTLAFAGGYLVGFDAGEWGGELSWFTNDGRRQQQLGDNNVRGFVSLGPVLAMAIEDHSGWWSSDGALRWIEYDGTKLDASNRTALPDGPQAFAETDRGTYVLTLSSLVLITRNRELRVVQRMRTGWLGPNSMAMDASGTLWIGMRRLVLRLTPAGDRFVESWFVREDCRRMEIVDYECLCRGS